MRGKKQKLALLCALSRAAGTLVGSGGAKRLKIRLSGAAVKQRVARLFSEVYGAMPDFGGDKLSVIIEGAVLEKILRDSGVKHQGLGVRDQELAEEEQRISGTALPGDRYGDTSAKREVPRRGFGNLFSEIDVPVPPTLPPGLPHSDGAPTVSTGNVATYPPSSPEIAVATLRGFFLGAGAVSLKSGYHLEFAFLDPLVAAECVNLLFGAEISEAEPDTPQASAGLPVKSIKRKGKTVVYLKDSAAVSDLLAYMGAHKAVLELYGLSASRDANRTTNRRLNCDMANIDKTVRAGTKQAELIGRLEESGALKNLDDKLRETAALRLSHPEASLSDLAELTFLTKSGIRNRLRKLCELAENHL